MTKRVEPSLRSFTFAGVEVGLEHTEKVVAEQPIGVIRFHPHAIDVELGDRAGVPGDERDALRVLAARLRRMADEVDQVVASPSNKEPR